tara:strand:- start:104 stop:988 length:885 start_codon:yes stop_codon:yes gene_type:complete
MYNLLFVGGSGLLGNIWIKKLDTSIRIFATINKKKIKTKKKNLVLVKLDLFNEKKLCQFIKQNNIDTIINVAGFTNIEQCEKDKKKAFKINVNIVKNLKVVAKKFNIKIIHISTDHIFNGKKIGYYSEKSKTSPINYYSKTKLMAENKIKQYKKSLIIRTNFFGGKSDTKNSFSEYILNNIINKKYTCLWSNIYFTPVNINFLIDVVNKLIIKNKFGIINISSNDKISKFNFGLKLCKHLKLNEKYLLKKNEDNNSVERPKNMSLSNKKLIKIFPDLKKKLFLNYQINNIYKKR